jgi:hypothetical protein
MNPKRKKHLYNFWRPPTNSNHQSTVSKELKFKKLKLLLKKLLPMVEINRLIPNHQFGFRQRHSTIEQTH